MALLDELEQMRERALADIAGVDSPDQLESARVRYLGRSGALKDMMTRIKEVPPADKKAAGQRLNAVKQELESAWEAKKSAAGAAAPQSGPLPDPTLPGRHQPLGTMHPLTQAMERFAGIFEKLGFTVRTGPYGKR